MRGIALMVVVAGATVLACSCGGPDVITGTLDAAAPIERIWEGGPACAASLGIYSRTSSSVQWTTKRLQTWRIAEGATLTIDSVAYPLVGTRGKIKGVASGEREFNAKAHPKSDILHIAGFEPWVDKAFFLDTPDQPYTAIRGWRLWDRYVPCGRKVSMQVHLQDGRAWFHSDRTNLDELLAEHGLKYVEPGQP